MTREADARRPFLFLALSAFMGMLLYFAADYEPSLLTPLVGLIPILILIAYAMPRPTRELFLKVSCLLQCYPALLWRPGARFALMLRLFQKPQSQ